MSGNDKNTERDFLDISELVEKKAPTPTSFSHTVKLATVADDSDEEEKKNEQAILPSLSPEFKASLHTKKVENDSAFSYTPEHNALIKRVTVIDEQGGFNFYATFKEDAESLFDKEGSECPYAPYFSYVPQYIQLTEAQKNYYLWWRTCHRRGENIKSDYSYFWLYVYEIINLPNIIPPKEGVKMLCRVWRDYRALLPNVDKNMMAWLCDYCLLHALPCPSEELADFLPLVIEESEFKEFYLGQKDFDELNVDYIICASSDYNWHKSKILRTEKAKELFSRHMNASIYAPIRALFDGGHISLSSENTQTLSYSAFRRSLCGYFNKKHIEVEYCSLSHSQSIRAVITMIVKYAENKLRAMLSVKSRLAIINLPEEYKALVDAYFAILPENKAVKVQARPEYEKLYDALDTSISMTSASEIEMSSWDVARLLTENDNSDDENVIPNESKIVVSEKTKIPEKEEKEEIISHTTIESCGNNGEREQQKTESAEKHPSDTYGLCADYISFISALLEQNTAKANAIAASLGKTAEGVSEYINEKFFDSFGDIIIEISDNTCQILPDYLQELTQWLNS